MGIEVTGSLRVSEIRRFGSNPESPALHPHGEMVHAGGLGFSSIAPAIGSSTVFHRGSGWNWYTQKP